ncbi:2-dehydro-3-deoxyglucarate aldolase [Corynebacterium poyangense]|uniref:2-dehydro-3-deoxyglucarate aldolase n=1 Tax=Corynebacterium poyangense TaxID=2684405 RepID=A0A7H0SMF2_9CORY|nr:aldolase/citrate lyase family protein [Corynebacterium poyangense]MBZ8176828.1 2-dehydro-3-deoxyglucarate aldolase [Corynebacterium poyangense]QNQ89727.1 2-dehydro-3-deoxyglucarate aldolase [Corynebacterium poyangense]
MSLHLAPPFPHLFDASDRPKTGLWICSGSPTAAEIIGGSGCDWVLIDGEHSPITVEKTLSLLQAVAAYPVVPVVRVPVNDTVLIKQFLDLGAQNIMVPMVHTAEDARRAVAAMHYPPRGVRGVGSALARSSRWNLVDNYLAHAAESISLIVQIESAEAVSQAAEIAGTEGVDALFIGPSDLAASMGYLGQQTHPEVLDNVRRTIAAAKEARVVVGVNCFNLEQARSYAEQGVDFIAIGADVQILASGSQAMLAKFNS